MNRIKTGILGLDDLIGGGIPPRFTILTIEDAGVGGDVLLYNIALQQKLKKNLVLNVIVDPSNYYILHNLLPHQSDEFMIMDAISDANQTRFSCKPPLHEINLTLKEARRHLVDQSRDLKAANHDDFKEFGAFILFWSLNPLLINFEAKDVLHFFFENIRESIRYGTIEVYLLQKGIVKDTVLKSLMAFSHAVWDLSSETNSGKRDFAMNILKMSNQDFSKHEVEYVFKDNKFTLVNSFGNKRNER